MKVLKLLGLAGILGVAATGAVIARQQRARSAYTPEQVRARLHERLAQADADPATGSATPAEVPPGG